MRQVVQQAGLAYAIFPGELYRQAGLDGSGSLIDFGFTAQQVGEVGGEDVNRGLNRARRRNRSRREVDDSPINIADLHLIIEIADRHLS